MYVWRVKPLASDFRAGQVTQREQFKCVLTYGIILTIVMSLDTSSDWQPAILYYVNSFAEVAVIIFGTAACYHANRTGDDKDFIARNYCLGFPVGVSTLTVMGLPMVVVMASLHPTSSPLTLGIEELVGLLVIGVVYYWRLWRWTRRVAHSGPEPSDLGLKAEPVQQPENV
jgi:hypothetical protein